MNGSMNWSIENKSQFIGMRNISKHQQSTDCIRGLRSKIDHFDISLKAMGNQSRELRDFYSDIRYYLLTLTVVRFNLTILWRWVSLSKLMNELWRLAGSIDWQFFKIENRLEWMSILWLFIVKDVVLEWPVWQRGTPAIWFRLNIPRAGMENSCWKPVIPFTRGHRTPMQTHIKRGRSDENQE